MSREIPSAQWALSILFDAIQARTGKEFEHASAMTPYEWGVVVQQLRDALKLAQTLEAKSSVKARMP